MSTAPLPEKLEKLYQQASELILPHALKAAGAVLITIKTGGDSDDADGPSKTAQFSEHYSQALRGAFARLLERHTRSSEKKTGKAALEERIKQYSLVGKEELEAQLAVERHSRTLFNNNSFAISALSMRMEKAIGRPFLVTNNPLHPQQLGVCFRESCEKVARTRASSDAALTSWVKTTEKHYAEWVEALNQSLIRQGILPQLDEEDVDNRYRHSRESTAQKADAMRKNVVAEITGKPVSEDGEQPSSQELMQGISRLINQAQTADPSLQRHIITGNDNGPAADTHEVITALEQVKTEQVVNPETGYRQFVPQNTLAQMIHQQTELASRALNEQTQNSIAMLSMMFEKITAEENIAEPIKPLIADLQVPVLQRALQEDSFFADSDNSAQQLVNEIAKAGTHWIPKQNADRDIFYKKIASIVEDVQENHANEEDVFEKNLLTLSEFVEKEERRTALIEERMVEAELAQARKDSARQQARDTIGVSLSGVPVPQHTRYFAEHYWEQVLFFYLNQPGGEHSEGLQQALQDLDSLIRASQGEAVDLKNLFQSLNKQLVDQGFEKGDREQTFKDLLAELKTRRADAMAREQQAAAQATASAPAAPAVPAAASATSETAPPSQAAAEPTAADTTTEASPATAPAAALQIATPPPAPVRLQPAPVRAAAPAAANDIAEVDDRHSEIAEAIRVNSWFRYRPTPDEDIKVKLAAIIKHNGNYIFVNREGMKLLTTTQAGVAQHFREGKLLLIEDGIFFDRALESVIQSLRR